MTLTEKIIELVPDVYWKECQVCEFRHPGTKIGYCGHLGCEAFVGGNCTYGSRTVTLADVLRAIQRVKGSDGFVLVASNGWMSNGADRCRWDFLSTDLDGQSEETKAFISKILGV